MGVLLLSSVYFEPIKIRGPHASGKLAPVVNNDSNTATLTMWYALMTMRRDGQTLVVVADLRAPLRDWPLWAGETVEIERQWRLHQKRGSYSVSSNSPTGRGRCWEY
jgi:hypothetical protein